MMLAIIPVPEEIHCCTEVMPTDLLHHQYYINGSDRLQLQHADTATAGFALTKPAHLSVSLHLTTDPDRFKISGIAFVQPGQSVFNDSKPGEYHHAAKHG